MKYGIVIFPSREIQDLANPYRKRYDSNYSLIPPHITLKYDFSLQDRKLADIVTHLEKIARETAPFEIEFHKVNTFYPTTNVIYMAIKDEEPLIRLHEACNSGLLDDGQAYSYVPHMTIGQKLSDGELHDVYVSLRMMQLNATTTVDRFHLLYEMDNGMWTVYQTFLLSEQP
ncbi:2'-5' RNA ligase family protein [Numidum massiliense]|uniref:2'-5' RNA ligase family protein n=1 Tax=Numidum massiliense TaxID=1522315 RepID=UPI0006D58532|nr:2'-5' RNA ligase family protein [Numidum massiliense]